MTMCRARPRITQEGLRNVKRHSDAHSARVKLASDGNEVSLIITDTGIGFDVTKGTVGIGLRSMKERLRTVGGAIDIRSKPEVGTQISVRIPIG